MGALLGVPLSFEPTRTLSSGCPKAFFRSVGQAPLTPCSRVRTGKTWSSLKERVKQPRTSYVKKVLLPPARLLPTAAPDKITDSACLCVLRYERSAPSRTAQH